jgi:hypothetical protein
MTLLLPTMKLHYDEVLKQYHNTNTMYYVTLINNKQVNKTEKLFIERTVSL